MLTIDELRRFLRESLHIEGIDREPTESEMKATRFFLDLESPTRSDVAALVAIYAPHANLRDKRGRNVRVGDHIPMLGGPEVAKCLDRILIELPRSDPYQFHLGYELLHPFTDGNGRSGRALWAWQMVRQQDGLPLAFLHQFYYQALAAQQRVERVT